jgi:LCP family protein required for cell wall assembly
MFDHLDDEIDFRPDAAFRAAAHERGRRLRRRRRAATGLSVGGCSVMMVAASALWWGDHQLDRIDRVDIGADTLAPPPTAPSEPTYFLIVGVDGATDLAGGDGVRADSIVLVRAGTDGRLGLLSVPRDLWIGDGTGGSRINQLLQSGGPERLVAAVSDTLGVPVHHYVQMDFAGVQAVTDDVGGVPVAFDRPVRDRWTGLEVLTPGCVTLDGRGLLALARSRHLEVQTPYGWEADPTSDIGRMERQRAIGEAGIQALVALDPSPDDVLAFVDVLAEHAVLDSELARDDMVEWGRWLVARGEADVGSFALPVGSATVDGASVLELAPGWEDTIVAFTSGAAPPAGAIPSGGQGAPVTVQPC